MVIDYGTRTPEECVIDGIHAMAREILSPQHVATGDAADWADSVEASIGEALAMPADSEARAWHLSDIWDIGAEYLYTATGLHAYEDGYAGGLFFLTDDELVEVVA